MPSLRFGLAALVLLLSACASTPAPSADPQAQFWASLRTLCGKTVAGGVLEAGDPVLDKDFASNPLVMGPVSCLENEVAIPFAVGADASRTWLLTRTPAGLRLKHVHAHAGLEDALSRYGGDTASPGQATRQEFPADAFSKELFTRTGRTVSLDNVWAVEVTPGAEFVYELRRPGRLVRVRFALASA